MEPELTSAGLLEAADAIRRGDEMREEAREKIKQDEYERLGIFPDTWACVAVLVKKEAQRYAFNVAASGAPVKISLDPDGKRWHVAVQGGLPKNPIAWIVGLRDEPYEPVSCTTSEGQHPQAEK